MYIFEKRHLIFRTKSKTDNVFSCPSVTSDTASSTWSSWLKKDGSIDNGRSYRVTKRVEFVGLVVQVVIVLYQYLVFYLSTSMPGECC